MKKIKKIISGGQNGVDQGALEFAFENNILSGGWCPKGRLCENGKIPEKFPLQETLSNQYSERTKMNIINSDGTLIISYKGTIDKGTKLTQELCLKNNKPFLLLNITEFIELSKKVFPEWLENNKLNTLNIAGPRESNCPGIQSKTKEFLKMLFGN
ncbi:MAG: putative molybdenum carrier protein [Bacteroidales bacterium]|nr:putative molybdenum carrier protein [Bacteroidales bacterium]